MNTEAEEICEQLDAALFSGDTFLHADDLTALRGYLARWSRRVEEIKDEPLNDE